jgi:hypothetical protein
MEVGFPSVTDPTQQSQNGVVLIKSQMTLFKKTYIYIYIYTHFLKTRVEHGTGGAAGMGFN